LRPFRSACQRSRSKVGWSPCAANQSIRFWKRADASAPARRFALHAECCICDAQELLDAEGVERVVEEPVREAGARLLEHAHDVSRYRRIDGAVSPDL